MKFLTIIATIILAQSALAKKTLPSSNCLDINDDKVILRLKPKQQLALLTLRKESQSIGVTVGKRCYDINKQYFNMEGIVQKINVHTIFKSNEKDKYSCNSDMNVSSSKSVDEAHLKIKIAECMAESLNKSKKAMSKDILNLPPICAKYGFNNADSNEPKKLAEAAAAAKASAAVKANIGNTATVNIKPAPKKTVEDELEE